VNAPCNGKYVVAILGKKLSGCPSYAARRAGNQSYLLHHVFSLCHFGCAMKFTF
jgi:hypothetical protein